MHRPSDQAEEAADPELAAARRARGRAGRPAAPRGRGRAEELQRSPPRRAALLPRRTDRPRPSWLDPIAGLAPSVGRRRCPPTAAAVPSRRWPPARGTGCEARVGPRRYTRPPHEDHGRAPSRATRSSSPSRSTRTSSSKAIDAAFRKLAREVRIPGLPARQGAPPAARGPARHRGRPARRRCSDSLPEYYAEAVDEHDVDVIAPPEIEITAGRGRRRRRVRRRRRDAARSHRRRLRRAAGRRIDQPEVDRRGGRRADRPAARAASPSSPTSTARSSTATTSRIDIEGSHRRRGGRGPHRHRLPLRGRHRHRRARARRGAARRAARRRSSSSPPTSPSAGERAADATSAVARQGGQGEGAARAHRRVGERGVASSRPSTSCAPTCATRLDMVQAGAGARWRCARRSSRRSPSSSTDEVPETLVDSEMQQRARRTSRTGSQAQGIDLEQYLEATGQDQQEFVDELRDDGRPRPSRPTSRCGPWSTPRRSRRPTTSSTPRSSASPSGSTQKPAKVRKRARTQRSSWRRYARTSHKARRSSSWSSTSSGRRGGQPSIDRAAARRSSRRRPTADDDEHRRPQPTIDDPTRHAEQRDEEPARDAARLQLPGPDGHRADQPRASGPSTSTRGCSRTASSSWARRSTTPSPTSIIAQLLHLESEDPDKDIIIYINSPGGEITGAVRDLRHDAVHQARRARPSASARPRRPRRCCSPPGTPGKRFILPHARVLIHQPHGGASGQAVDIEIQAKEIMRMRELLDEILAHHTGQRSRRSARTPTATSS